MSTILDPLALFLERKGAIPSIVGSYFPNWLPNAGENVNCPWHEDTRASLHISLQGKAYCHGCKECARNIIELVAKMESITETEAGRMLYDAVVDPIPEGRLQAFVKNLSRNMEAMDYLLVMRNLTEKTIKNYRLGLDPKDDRIIIPVFDQFGGCVNIRRMGWLPKHEKKALNKKGAGDARLYPENLLVLERRVLLVEGEFDCLVGRSNGLPTYTWTCGANSWDEEQARLLADKAVFILFDNDRAGREAAVFMENALKPIAYHVEIVPPLNHKSGKDLTDWSFTSMDNVHALGERIRMFRFPAYQAKPDLCPYCHQVMPIKSKSKMRVTGKEGEG